MINIDQPHLINVYNSTMGGVDRADQNIGAYRIQIRTKKWWWPLFAFYVDASVQNAWLLYRHTPAARSQPMDQLAFKRAIVHVFLLRYKQDRAVGRPLTGRGPCISKRVPDEIRRDKAGHYFELDRHREDVVFGQSGMLPGARLIACKLARLNHQDPHSNAHGSHLTANKVPNSRERSRFRGIEESDGTTEAQ
ncbi:PiggyBac transposable element-derived protein 3 [Elysia marginata]|uniref:PiggyBac transposable element-derived protein 3 n=1 Tax=Elysia marginata TaxID=1093978 RepID=A0AAV4FNF1_9GAST|nr:PiggyBac transposable element-derived protein 3 [Elysia marginata]